MALNMHSHRYTLDAEPLHPRPSRACRFSRGQGGRQSSLWLKGSHFVVLLHLEAGSALAARQCRTCPPAPRPARVGNSGQGKAGWAVASGSGWVVCVAACVRVQCFFCSKTRHSTYSSPTVSKQTTPCASKQLETGTECRQRGPEVLGRLRLCRIDEFRPAGPAPTHGVPSRGGSLSRGQRRS